ncbi:MAG: hypothetical protein AB8F26_04945 [Phycisphaerales bacterium]
MPDSDHPKRVFSLFGYCAMLADTTLIWVFTIIAGLISGSVVGCGSTETTRDDPLSPYVEEASSVLAVDAPMGGASDPAARGWSVLIAVVPTNRPRDAEEMLGTVQSAGLGEAYLVERSGRSAVVYGSYDDPGSDDAQAGLQRVREMQIGGMTPFAAAILIPPPAAMAQSSGNEFDLRTVKARVGERAVYTLQVAVYGRSDLEKATPEDLKVFRAQAEQAVIEMRADGHDAFFYHGPNSSSVTIGVFDEDDHDGTTVPPVESVRLRVLRKEFPNNLLNGEGLMETVRTERGPVKRLQASRLVAIPQK